METSFYYATDDKQLCFKLREKVTTSFNVELKAKGWFNPSTGGLVYRGHAKKNFLVGQEDKDAGSKPLTLGLGAAVTSDSTEPVLVASVKKQMSLLEGPNTVVSAKAEVDASIKGGNALTDRVSLKLSHKAMNFTKRQDLKLAVGLDLEGCTSGKPKPMPRLQIRENNWAANYRWNKVFFTYDL